MHQTAPVAELRRESQEGSRPSQEGPRESGGSHDSITYFSIFPWVVAVYCHAVRKVLVVNCR